MPQDAAASAGSPRRRGRLFRKYVVVIVALVSGALLVSGAIELYFSYEETAAQLVALQGEKARGAAARIESFIRQIEDQMGWTTQPVLAVGPAALEQRRIDFLRLLRQVPAITELDYVDPEGREQVHVSRVAMDVTGEGRDVSTDPRFVQARAARVYHGPVYFRKESEPYMAIAMAQSGGGVTVAEVNLKFIWDVVSQITIGKAGRAFVVDGGGNLIAHPDISLVLQKTNLARLSHVAAALTGEAPRSETAVARDVGGHRVLTAHATIPALKWGVIVEQPLGEAFEPLRAAIQRTVLLIALGVGFAVLASLVLARRMVRPIKALETGAAKIGAGELAHRIDDVRTGDELEALAERFNQAAERLEESYATLEHRVQDRTHELSEALEQQTATSEILQVISQSPTDVRPVLTAVVAAARRFCGADDAMIGLRESATVVISAHEGPLPANPDVPRPLDRSTVMGRTILDGRLVHIGDYAEVSAEEFGAGVTMARRHGFQAALAAPMLRDGVAVGCVLLRKTGVGEFSPRQIALLETFAAQAVIALENVRLFTELRDKTIQLQVANQHKSDFLANMSHELRTPLNAVIGFSEVLLERMFGDINDKQEEYLNDILASGRHLLSLINDILDLSKIEAGRMELDLTQFDLPAAIDDALVLVRERAARRGLTITRELDDRLGAFVGDERKIKQVLLNLLSNAIKFTPEGGRVDVRAALKGGVVEIAVADSGVGIAPEDREAVFEEFRQVGTDLARKHEGTGLGLALTRRFVDLHGGDIWLESEVGVGSTFTFALPVRPWPAS